MDADGLCVAALEGSGLALDAIVVGGDLFAWCGERGGELLEKLK